MFIPFVPYVKSNDGGEFTAYCMLMSENVGVFAPVFDVKVTLY